MHSAAYLRTIDDTAGHAVALVRNHGHQDQRREEVHNLVGRMRNDILFRHGFEAVGERLEEAVGSDAVGAVAVLDAANALAFKNRDDGEDAGENRQNQDHGQQRRPT